MLIHRSTVMHAFMLLFACAAHSFAQPNLDLRDKEKVLVYEVFYQPGTVVYRETTTPTKTYNTRVSAVGNQPWLAYWNTERQRNTRTFGAIETEFPNVTAPTLADAAVWVYRETPTGRPAAVILALPSQEGTVGRTGAPLNDLTITVPARSVASAAVILRRAPRALQFDFDQMSVEGNDDKGGFIEIARNESSTPRTITVRGFTTAPGPAAARRRMMVRSIEVGPGVTLITGTFPNERTAAAAAVIITPIQ